MTRELSQKFNRMAFWRYLQKHRGEIYALCDNVHEMGREKNFDKLGDISVQFVSLDLIGYSEVIGMYPKTFIEMDETQVSDEIRLRIVCDERPKQVLELLSARAKKAIKIIDAGRPAAFTPPKKDKAQNGFMGWRRFVKTP